MNQALSLGVGLFLGTPLAAQNLRTPKLLDTTSTGTAFRPVPAGDGAVNVVAYADFASGGNDAMYLVRSLDGGVAWSAPLRLDQDPSGATKTTTRHGVTVLDGHVYVSWIDARHGASSWDMYIRASHDGGVTWDNEVQLNKGWPPGVGQVLDWRLIVSPSAANPAIHNVYVLMLTEPPGVKEGLVMVSSFDNALTFTPANLVSSLAFGAAEVEGFGAAAEDRTVHVAWSDDRNNALGKNDVWYRRSSDGGLTWTAPELQLDTSGPGVGSADLVVNMDKKGSTIAVAWQERYTSSVFQEVRVAVSTDGGLSWQGDVMPGNYNPAVNDVDTSDVIVSDNAISVAWDDNRTGADEIYTAVTYNLGATWTETRLSFTGGGDLPHALRQRDRTTDVWGYKWMTATLPNSTYVAFTWNGGQSWAPALRIDGGVDDVDNPEGSFNADYNNFIAAWQQLVPGGSGDDRAYAGGCRSATLSVNGPLRAGSPVSFDFEYFSPGSGSHAAALASGARATGSYLLPFGDGRDLGLRNDGVLAASMGYIPGPLAAALNGAGAATTTPLTFPSSFPIGTPLYFAAVGFDLTSGVRLGDLSDVVVEIVQ